jgi:hypothetical protein
MPVGPQGTGRDVDVTEHAVDDPRRFIAALDVGAVRNVGWWRHGDSSASGGTDLNDLCRTVSDDLAASRQVALGFEAPSWIPRATDIEGLGRARRGDGNRAWSAGAGPSVLATGLQQATFVLDRLRPAAGRITVGLDPVRWLHGDFQLLLWEAFVSASAKDRAADNPHISDARAAVEAFRRRIAQESPVSDCEPDQVISLLGAALIVSGTTDDASVLHQAAFVVKVEQQP